MASLPTVFIRQLDGHQGAVRSVRFNVNGNYCITCGSDKLLKLWNPYTGIELKTYSGHGYEVLDASASDDSARIASCSADRTVVLWDVSTGQIVRKFRGHISVSICTPPPICFTIVNQVCGVLHDSFIIMSLSNFHLEG